MKKPNSQNDGTLSFSVKLNDEWVNTFNAFFAPEKPKDDEPAKDFYEELIDHLCPSTVWKWNPTPLLPKQNLHNQNNKNNQMKQKQFKSGDMISVATPRGITIAVLAEDFTYEKPCMVAVKTMLTYDGILTISDSVGKCQLYIHQDAIEVRLADEQEGLRLFSAIKASGAEMPKCRDGKVKEFEPFDGDFCFISDNNTVFISNGGFNTETGWPLFHCFITSHLKSPQYGNPNDVGLGFAKPRLATPSERQLLLDALAKQGLTWNATEKRVEKALWRAERGGTYFCLSFYSKGGFKPKEDKDNDVVVDRERYEEGVYFQHESECQQLCDQLNAVVIANKESRVKIN